MMSRSLILGWVTGVFSLTVPFVTMAAAGPPAQLIERESQRIQTLQQIIPSVVCVMAADGQGGGSGVLISADGFAVSNYHVTSGSGSFLKCGLSDGRVYDAVIVGIDPTGDVAMIQLLGRADFPFAVPGDSDAVRVGDEVMALGNPFLLAADFTPTATYGIVSGIRRYQYPANSFLEYTDCIQIDASINPGNSGGPLFDIEGKWIGINGRASFEKRGRVNAGAAYAISVRQVMLFAEHLKCGLIVDHGIADFTVESSSDGRAMVSQVSGISEAWRRGIRPQVELVSFAGRPVASANEFQNVLGIFPEGTRVPLSWRDRDGVHSATIRLRPLHAFKKAPELPGERKLAPDDPEQPHPELPALLKPKAKEVPAELNLLYEERDGFANYYFNRRRQNRLMQPLTQRLGPAIEQTRTWVLAVADASEVGANAVPGELIIGESGAGLVLGEKNFYQPADNPVEENEPAHFRGLLAAALQWHRLFDKRNAAFDEITAQGSTVHQPTGASADVLLTRSDRKSARWYFDGTSPLPFGVDVDYGEGFDEARVLLADWNNVGSLPTPGRIGVVDATTEAIHWLNVTGLSFRDPVPAAAAFDSHELQNLDLPPEHVARSSAGASNPRGEFIVCAVGQREGEIDSRRTTERASDVDAGNRDSYAPEQIIPERQSAVVKLFGAGVGNLDSYGSAVLISPDGHLMTVWNHLINVGYLTAMTDDGRKFAVRVIGTSREHDLAVLQLQADPGQKFPFINLADAQDALPGDSILAFSNMFHVATGREPVSVVHGIVASKTPLTAGNGRWSFPLKSPVLIVDAVTNNSGAAGGLLTRTDGTPLGLIGREIRHRGSNTWVNYAVPLITLAPVVDTLLSGRRVEATAADSQPTVLMADRQITATFGMTLLPDVVERTPAYIDGVVADSLAEQSGLKRGDLIVLLDDEIITSVTDFRRLIATRRSGQPISLTVSRNQQLIMIGFRVP